MKTDSYNDENYESDSNSGIVLNLDNISSENNIVRSESLYTILNEIKFNRSNSKSASSQEETQECKEFWIQLFNNSFIHCTTFDGGYKDDLLFFVIQRSVRNNEVEVKVFRRNSPRISELCNTLLMEWEQTVYLNLIVQHFTYILTMATVTRTGPREYQILRKVSEKVYASPSRRQMASKGTEEQMTYPQIYFSVDNFEEVFSSCLVRDSESVCVELTAYDHCGSLQSVLFIGTVRYNAIKSVYDKQNTFSGRFVRHTTGFFRTNSGGGNTGGSGVSGSHFIKMLGPDGKGHAEMAVSSRSYGGHFGSNLTMTNGGSESQLEWCGVESNVGKHCRCSRTISIVSGVATPTRCSCSKSMSTSFMNTTNVTAKGDDSMKGLGTINGKFTSNNPESGMKQYDYHYRRGSSKVADIVAGVTTKDGSNNENDGNLRFGVNDRSNIVRNVLSSKMKKSQSDGGTFDRSGSNDNSCDDVTVADGTGGIYCEDFEEYSQSSAGWGQSFNQAWYWFKERRKASSPALSTAVTYLSLPWHRIVADILDNRVKPILTFDQVKID